ncbi:MAG TPA: hypothetical protein VKU40_16775, partial [Thermoanaerobaculia bacterium]|nr:hypothetical protein [Thermoanaerobaculia bacterium]
MRNRFFLVIFVFVVLGLAFEAHAERVLLVRGEGAPALKELIAEIEAAGGRAPHVFPPGAAIVEVPDGPLPEWSGVEWVDHLVDVEEYAERGFWGRMAAVAWNAEIGMVFEMPPADQRAHEARLRSGRTFPPIRDDALLPPRHKSANPAKPVGPMGSARESMQVALPESLAVFADSTDTSEFMLGSVAVAIFLMESTGSTYNWSSNEIDTTLDGIYDGLEWWVDEGGAGANLSFVYEVQETTANSSVFSTTYEPITMDLNDDYIWINQAMVDLGYWSGNDAWTNVRFFDDDLRTDLETDWAFSIFVADSNPTVNFGRFTDDRSAHAFFGGPFFTMARYTTAVSNWEQYYEAIPAHEAGHLFYATDEYHYEWDTANEFDDESAGYLNVEENTNSYCMMTGAVFALCNATPGQVGWRDTDSDGIFDILDTEPATQLNAYPV